MSELYQGRVLDVTENTLGTEVTADHAIGAAVLSVYDTQEFNDDGGAVSIEGLIYGYTKKSDDASTITLTSPLTVAVTADTEVFIYPLAVEKEALVQIDQEEAVFASIPHQFVGVMEALVREEDAGESVIVAKEGDDYEIHDLLAETYTVYGEYIDLTGVDIPPPVPTTAPAVSPAVRVTGFTSALVAETDAVEAGTTIQYHISTIDGFAPGPTTLFTETEATVATIDKMPDGSELDPAEQYYVRTLAYNVIGSAAPSAQVAARLNLSNVDALVTTKLIASFIQTGKISVGQFTLDAVGMRVNRPGGGYVFNFPFNGVDNMEITAAVVAVSLNIVNNLTINGQGNLNGILQAANGIIAPTSQPGMTRTWPKTTTFMYDGDDKSEWFHGMIETPGSTTSLTTAMNFVGTTTIRSFHKATGLWTGDVSIGSWKNTFAPLGGIVSMTVGVSPGLCYFVMGTDSARAGKWYIYRIVAATGAKDAEVEVAADWSFFEGAYPRLFTDGTNLFYAFVNSSKALRVVPVTTAPALGTGVTIMTGLASRYNLGDVHIGNHDGIGNRVFFAFRGSMDVLCFNPVTPSNPNTWTRDSTYDFQRPAPVSGMTYDTTNGQMLTLDTSAQLFYHGKYPVNKSVISKYAWFDANATGGTHETQPGPSRTYTLPARSYLSLQSEPPPDINNVDPLNTDKANQVAMYATDDGGTIWRRLIYTANPWGADYSTLQGLASGTPKVTNEFLSSTVATPGQFRSTATDSLVGGTSSPIISLNGAGVGRMGQYTTARHFGSRTRTSDQSVPNAVDTVIALGATKETAVGLSWDATNNRFVVAKAGVYMGTINLRWAINATGRRLCSVLVNGVAVSVNYTSGSAGAQTQSFVVMLALNVNDTVQLVANQTSGAALLLVGTSDQTWFDLAWIAP